MQGSLNQFQRSKDQSLKNFIAQENAGKLYKLSDGNEEIKPKHPKRVVREYRKKAFRLLPNCCNRCGYNTIIKILEVHHIDKDRGNNNIENLEILCPNCHKANHFLEKTN